MPPEKLMCLRWLAYGLLHLLGCYIALYDPERFSDTKLFPFVNLAVAFGPLAFAIENYIKFQINKGGNK